MTDNTLVINLIDKKNSDYIFYYLGNIGLNKMIFGSGQPLITGGQLKALPVLLPCMSEREKISSLFSSLDDLIAAQSDKLCALKTNKRGLMQQLFPSAVEAEG